MVGLGEVAKCNNSITMPCQRMNALVLGDIPEFDGIVFRSGCQLVGLGEIAECSDGITMPSQRMNALIIGEIPDFDSFVARSGCQ